MNIKIEELYFDESNLRCHKFDSEEIKQNYINGFGKKYGEKCLKHIELFLEDDIRSIIIPTVGFDNDGNYISCKNEDRIPSAPIKFEKLMKFVFDNILACWENYHNGYSRWNSLIPDFSKDIWVYICYRKDMSNDVGICIENYPLHIKVDK